MEATEAEASPALPFFMYSGRMDNVDAPPSSSASASSASRSSFQTLKTCLSLSGSMTSLLIE